MAELPDPVPRAMKAFSKDAASLWERRVEVGVFSEFLLEGTGVELPEPVSDEGGADCFLDS